MRVTSVTSPYSSLNSRPLDIAIRSVTLIAARPSVHGSEQALVGERHLAVADDRADDRRRHRLGHRPAEQRRLGRKPLCRSARRRCGRRGRQPRPACPVRSAPDRQVLPPGRDPARHRRDCLPARARRAAASPPGLRLQPPSPLPGRRLEPRSSRGPFRASAQSACRRCRRARRSPFRLPRVDIDRHQPQQRMARRLHVDPQHLVRRRGRRSGRSNRRSLRHSPHPP